MNKGIRESSLVSRDGFYGTHHGAFKPVVVRSRGVGHLRPLMRKPVQKRSLLLVASVAIVLSFSILALNGSLLPSSSDPVGSPGWDERAAVSDWPADYLNETVTSIGPIHSDIGTYDGKSVTVQGNVTAAPGEYDNGYFFIQDSTGGLMVNASGSGFTFGVSRGDFVRLNGTADQTVQGMHTIENSLSYWVMSTGNSVEVEHMYNSSLVATSHQGLLVKMNGYLTNFSYSNTSHTAPDWEKSVSTSTLWMYNRTFLVQATNITLSDYDGFAMVTGVMFFDDGTYTLQPRSTSDIDPGNGPFDYPYPDGDLSDWSQSEMAVDDPDDDAMVSGNEILSYYITWDEAFLYVAVDYTVTTGHSVIIYFDAIPGGNSNVSAIVGDGEDWRRHVEFFEGFKADMMLCRYNVEALELYRLDWTSSSYDVSSEMVPACSGVADGSGATIEAAIPWNSFYGMGPGLVSVGSTIRVVAVMTYSIDSNALDSAPSDPLGPNYGNWAKLHHFYDFCVDCDLDGYPDDYSSGFTIPEFSTLLVVPLLAVVVFIARARRRKT